MLTQSQMAHELKLSRSVVNDNVRAGMPLESVEAARHWRGCHVNERYNKRRHWTPQIALPTEDELKHKITHAEFAALLEGEFRRFENESPKQGDKVMSTSYCPSLLLAVWAVKGCMAYGCIPEGAHFLVARLMEELRGGYGDVLFKGLAAFDGEELSKGFVLEVEASEDI